MQTLIFILMGCALGLLFSAFTVEDYQLVKHNCAYYDKTTGDLVWTDTNKSVH